MKSVFVRELEELGKRLEEDGYPPAIVERAAERMNQLEDLVIKNDQEFQQIGKDIQQMRVHLKGMSALTMGRRQAE